MLFFCQRPKWHITTADHDLFIFIRSQMNPASQNQTVTALSALLCTLQQKWIMRERPNHAQSAQLLMARNAWFWHAAKLSQITSVTCVCKGGETKQFQKSFEPSQWWSSDNVLCLLLGEKKIVRRVNVSERMTSGRRHKQNWADFTVLKSKNMEDCYVTVRHILRAHHCCDFSARSIFVCH